MIHDQILRDPAFIAIHYIRHLLCIRQLPRPIVPVVRSCRCMGDFLLKINEFELYYIEKNEIRERQRDGAD